MNFFRFIADSLHLLSFIIIIYKLHKDKSCRGVSAKTQEIYLIVFCTRYLDLFLYFVSFYNTLMKILFIGVTIYILYLMHISVPLKNTYNRKTEDIFPHVYLIPFALIMTIFIHSNWDWWEFTWSFSLWLESVAIFPQITILSRENSVENFTAHYIASLGAYRFFYILHWIYRYFYDDFVSFVSVASGTLQVVLYGDFFYLYLKNLKKNFTSELPISSSEEKKLKENESN